MPSDFLSCDALRSLAEPQSGRIWRSRLARSSSFFVFLLVLGGSFSSARAEQVGETMGLRLASGSRRVDTGGLKRGETELARAPQGAKTKASVPAHQKGKAPKTPLSELPAGVPLSEPDVGARRAVAEGPTREQLSQGAEDPELIELRSAEAVLFPTLVRGIEPGWSWDLPESGGTSQEAWGLPLRSSLPVVGTELSRSDAEWLRSLTLPDLPVRIDRRVVTYLKFYKDSPRGRTIAAIWAKKSGRYVGAMKAELRRQGLPTDLVWLSMIESGHNPTIASPAGAVGLWQFMPHSGRMYGLTVDRWVDERRDPARATGAAIRLLSDLYQRFGSWELAMAAYNMGYAGLSRSISKYNTNDYWTLSRLEGGIPWETTLYVPKIFALAIVMNNREAFGLSRIQADPPVSFDTILVEPATPLKDVAQAVGISREELAQLNPSYLSDRVPPPAQDSATAWPLRVPLGKGAAATQALASKAKPRFETVVVRSGEDLSTLAEDFGLKETELVRQNGLGKSERLLPGTVLLLPVGSKRKTKNTAESVFVVSRELQPGPEHELVFYDVRTGDDLEELATVFQVTARELAQWNSLDRLARLREGMTLQVLVKRGQDLSLVRHHASQGARILIAASPEFHEHFEAQRGMRRIEVVVQSGDTLSSIGSKYGMTVGSMERVNRRSRSTKLIPGETLVVYTNKPGSSAALEKGAQPLEEIVPPRPELLPDRSGGSR